MKKLMFVVLLAVLTFGVSIAPNVNAQKVPGGCSSTACQQCCANICGENSGGCYEQCVRYPGPPCQNGFSCIAESAVRAAVTSVEV